MFAFKGQDCQARGEFPQSSSLVAPLRYNDRSAQSAELRALETAYPSPTPISAAIALESFDGLESSDLEKLNALTHVVEYPHGKVLVSEGAGERVHFVTSGLVRLQKFLPDGRRVVLGFAAPGDVVGFSTCDTLPYSAEAVRTVHTCSVSRSTFANLLEASPSLLRFLLSQFAHQMTMAQTQMMLLGRCSAKEKIANFLLELRDRRRSVNIQSCHIALPMSRQDIADFLGLTIETVSRTLTQLARAKIIDIVPQGVRVTDLDNLRRIAEG